MKAASRPLTQHDLLKTAALLLMIIDHLGFFLWPDAAVLRAIGRASAPIWLFLVGYNRKNDLDWSLLLAAGAMLVVQPYFTGHWLPLNILLSIILARLALPYLPLLLRPLATPRLQHLPGLPLLALAIILYPSHLAWEYGVFAFLFAGWGWWVRAQQENETPFALYPRAPFVFAAVTFAMYALYCTVGMQLTPLLVGVMLAVLLPVALWLAAFRAGPLAWPLPSAGAVILAFCGRNSLLIYVLHYLLLGAIAKAAG